MNTCAICQRNQTTYSINVPVDYDPEISATKHVCGSCCDIIATLAARPLLIEIETRLARLEVFTGMAAPAPLPVDDSMSMHFVNGEVDYIEPGALIDNDTDELPY